jgi:hypothetical protein
MRTAVTIPDPIFVAADDLARRLGVSRSALYARALKVVIAADREADLTTALDQAHRGRPSRLDASVARAQARSLSPW